MTDKIKEWEAGEAGMHFQPKERVMNKADLKKDYRGTYVPGQGFTGSGSAAAGTTANQSVDKESVASVKDITNPLPGDPARAMKQKMGKGGDAKCMMASMVEKAEASSGWGAGPKMASPVATRAPDAVGKTKVLGGMGRKTEGTARTAGVNANRNAMASPTGPGASFNKPQVGTSGNVIKPALGTGQGGFKARTPMGSAMKQGKVGGASAASVAQKAVEADKGARLTPELKPPVAKAQLDRQTRTQRESVGQTPPADSRKPLFSVHSEGADTGAKKVQATGLTHPQAVRIESKAARKNPGTYFSTQGPAGREGSSMGREWDAGFSGTSDKKNTGKKVKNMTAKSIMDQMMEKAGPANDKNERGPVSGTPHGGKDPAQMSCGDLKPPNKGAAQMSVSGTPHAGSGPAKTSSGVPSYPNRGPAQTCACVNYEGPGNDSQVNKAVTSMSVPRMPRALAASVEQWRDAPRVRTSGMLTGELVESIESVPTPQNPVVKACGSCGRTYTLRKSGDGCPTCSSMTVPSAID